MANNTINMSKLRQILRLHTQRCSKLQISLQTGISRNTLKKYIKDFTSSGITFEELNTLSDQDLESLFIKSEEKPLNEKIAILFSRFPAMDKELKRKGVTQQLLWEEYRKQYPGGLGITQFRHYYGHWKA
jgi:hypothetical protein